MPAVLAAEAPPSPPPAEQQKSMEASPSVAPVPQVVKSLYLPGISTNQKLNEAISIETLADVVTPLIPKGSALPASVPVKLGLSKNCNCAQLRLFRDKQDGKERPFMINDDALVGFSSSPEVVEVILEAVAGDRLNLRVSPEVLGAEKKLQWITMVELKAAQAEAKRKAATKIKKAKVPKKKLISAKTTKSKKSVSKKKVPAKPAAQSQPKTAA